jgi:hypothetical protein
MVILQYSTKRPRLQRLIKIAIVCIFVGVVCCAVKWGPLAWRRVRVKNLESQCESYSEPATTIAYQGNSPESLDSLLESDPARYVLTDDGALRISPYWDGLELAIRPNAKRPIPHSITRVTTPAVWFRYTRATLFLHERTSPAGNRRLVVVQVADVADFVGAVVMPGDWLNGPALVPGTDWPDVDKDSTQMLYWIQRTNRKVVMYFGQVNPSDSSRFTINFVVNKVKVLLDGWLDDNDTVHLKVRDLMDVAKRMNYDPATGGTVDNTHEETNPIAKRMQERRRAELAQIYGWTQQ